MPKKGGLGKGLSALVSETVAETYSAESGAPITIALKDIRPNDAQPRFIFDEEKLNDLKQSIEEVGIIQPIIVRSIDNGYEIIAGERRYQAAKLAGLTEVPVIIRNTDEVESLQLALIENIQRHDLNALEEAIAYNDLIDRTGITQAELAKRLSKSRAAVTNTLRLLELSDQTKELLKDGSITAGHARALLSIKNQEAQDALALRIVREGLSVRRAEELASQDQTPKKSSKRVQPENYKLIGRRLSEISGIPVKVKTSKSGVKIEFSIPDDDALLAFVDQFEQGR